jgi:hypothetical protein
MLAMDGVAELRTALGEIIAGPEKASVRDFATVLGKLSLHYWRPEFTPEQAKLLYGDFVRLLDGVTALELRIAADEWLMDPLNRFYPTPGQLAELLEDKLLARAAQRAGAERLLWILNEDCKPSEPVKARDMSALKAMLDGKTKAPDHNDRGGDVGRMIDQVAEKMRA